MPEDGRRLRSAPPIELKPAAHLVNLALDLAVEDEAD